MTNLIPPVSDKSSQPDFSPDIFVQKVNMELYNKLLKISESNRLGLMAFILLFYGAFIAPATVMAIELGSQSVVQFLLSVLSGIILLCLNIAVQPIRIIFPFFLGTVGLHLLIILINVI